MKTKIHINQHNIRANAKGLGGLGSDKASELLPVNGGSMEMLPVITVKDYKQNRKTNEVWLVDDNGKCIAKLVYRPDDPLACGAKVWLECDSKYVVVGG